MTRSFYFARLAAVLLGLFVIAPTLHAQIRVDLELRRSLYLRYEPVLAFVNITNLSGRDLELSDDGNHKWFGFQIETGEGRLVPPYDADYIIDPIVIGAGQTVRRAINLTPVYPLTEYGMYRVRATIYLRDAGRYFSSAPLNIEITEGRLIWQQRVGVPAHVRGGPGTRTISLLAHRLPRTNQLYLRIQDEESGLVYCTHQLGRMVAFGQPQIELDAENNAHIFQQVAPSQFLYSKIGLGGEILGRQQYTATERRPVLRKRDDGTVDVIGGVAVEAAAEGAEPAPALPSVSDRPVALPDGAAATPDPTPGRQAPQR